MIQAETFPAVAVGVVLGLLVGFWAAQTIRGMLWGVTPSDPLTFTYAACLMVLITGLAAFIPARRGSKADPIVALRHE
jgi:ABC-type antimicrobial peptide transport system permease subunit